MPPKLKPNNPNLRAVKVEATRTQDAVVTGKKEVGGRTGVPAR